MKFRKAFQSDLEAIKSIDHVVTEEAGRTRFIEDAVLEGAVLLLLVDDISVGYSVLRHHFFENAFIEMVYLRDDMRGKGYGAALLNETETLARTAKIFSSTNQSNDRMRRVFIREGWRESGIIENLDEGDPEIVYFKRVNE